MILLFTVRMSNIVVVYCVAQWYVRLIYRYQLPDWPAYYCIAKLLPSSCCRSFWSNLWRYIAALEQSLCLARAGAELWGRLWLQLSFLVNFFIFLASCGGFHASLYPEILQYTQCFLQWEMPVWNPGPLACKLESYKWATTSPGPFTFGLTSFSPENI